MCVCAYVYTCMFMLICVIACVYDFVWAVVYVCAKSAKELGHWQKQTKTKDRISVSARPKLNSQWFWFWKGQNSLFSQNFDQNSLLPEIKTEISYLAKIMAKKALDSKKFSN